MLNMKKVDFLIEQCKPIYPCWDWGRQPTWRLCWIKWIKTKERKCRGRTRNCYHQWQYHHSPWKTFISKFFLCL